MCAAAIVTQHNIITDIAAVRPDKNDLMFINDFADEIVNKLTTYRSVSDIPDLVVKGNFPYRKYLKIPLTPIVSRNCRGCRKCQWYSMCRGGCKRYREPFVNNRLSINKYCSAYKRLEGMGNTLLMESNKQ